MSAPEFKPELEPRKAPAKARLGDLLIDKKLISQEQFEVALAEQKKSGHKLGQVLVEKGFLTEEAMLQTLAEQRNLPYVDISTFELDPDLVSPSNATSLTSIFPLSSWTPIWSGGFPRSMPAAITHWYSRKPPKDCWSGWAIPITSSIMTPWWQF